MLTTNCKYFILATSLLCLAVSVVVARHFHQCPDDFEFHDETQACCEETTCGKFQQVVFCEQNYGKDSCEACPSHTYMLDNTTSKYPFRCIEHICDSVTSKKSDTFSQTLDTHACPQFCQCDMNKGYCGTDPCRCEPMHYCGYGKEQNQQCGCVPITERMTTIVPDVTENRLTDSYVITNTTTTTLATVQITTIEDNEKTSTSEQSTEQSTEQSWNNQDVIFVMVAVILAILIVVVIVFGIAFIARRRAGKEESVSIINFILCGEHNRITNNVELEQKQEFLRDKE